MEEASRHPFHLGTYFRNPLRKEWPKFMKKVFGPIKNLTLNPLGHEGIDGIDQNLWAPIFMRYLFGSISPKNGDRNY